MTEKKLTPQEIVSVLVDAGWPPEHLHNAFRTTFFESSFRPDVTSEDDQVNYKPRTASYGLFQINPIFWSEEIKQFLRDEGLLENVDPDFTEPEYYYDKYKPEEEQGDVHKRVPVLSKREIELIMDPVLNAQFAFEHIFARHGWDGSGPDGTNVDAEGEPFMTSAWTSMATWINSKKFPGYDGKNNEYRDIRLREKEVQPFWEKTEGPTIVETSENPDNTMPIELQGLEGRQDETGATSLGTSRFLGDRVETLTQTLDQPPPIPAGGEFGAGMGTFQQDVQVGTPLTPSQGKDFEDYPVPPSSSGQDVEWEPTFVNQNMV